MVYNIGLEFDGSNLGDKRLDKRLKQIANQISVKPEESICYSIGSFHDCKAAYRFFSNPKVKPKCILKPHIQSTLSRISKLDNALLVLHDTTDLIYQKYKKTEGLGTITTGTNMTTGIKGIFLHNSLLTTEAGAPQGIIKQQYFTHEDYRLSRGQSEKNQKGINKDYPIEKKESFRWIRHVLNTDELIKKSGKTPIHVADREGDIYELLQSAVEAEALFVIRAKSNRRTKDEGKTNLERITFEKALEKEPEKGKIRIRIKDENGKEQPHELSVNYVEVRLYPPQRKAKSKWLNKLLPIKITVIELRSTINKDLHWRLITNIKIKSFEDVIRIAKIYKRRWLIECYHRVLKSGFGVEKARLKTRARLENYCALASVLAWRVMWLYLTSREKPDLLGTELLSQEEIEVLVVSKYSEEKDPTKLRAKEVVRIIAKLGGFLGRKSDKDPGMISIWKGWQALYERIKFMEELRCG